MPARDIPSLDADAYTVKRNLLREEYWVEDSDGDRVLSTERRVAEGKATYGFRDADDDVVFRVSSQNAFDATGDFVLVVDEDRMGVVDEDETGDERTEGNRRASGSGMDERTRGKRGGEPLFVLTRHLSFRQHHWTVARPTGEEIAEVRSRRTVISALNTVADLLSPFPQRYSVESPSGERIGEISGRFSLRTVLDVRIDRPGATPRATLLAAAIAVAVLEAT